MLGWLLADIEGVPLDVLGTFSTRRAEIEERLAIGGWSSPRAAEIAALTTRKAKQHDVDPATLRSRWREQARAMNFGPRQLAAVMWSGARCATDASTRAILSRGP